MKKKIAIVFSAVVLVFASIMPAYATSVSSFKDVKRGSWYYEAVEYATDLGLFSGTSKTTFSPGMKMSRAMLVTVLGRNSNVNTADYTFADPVFDDVSVFMYYTPYVNWGHYCGIVSGYGGGLFKPDYDLTREQMVTLFYFYAQKVGYDTTVLNTKLYDFDDYNRVSTWAVEPMRWAVSQGFISGDDKNCVNPKKCTTRAEVAQMLYSASEVIEFARQVSAPSPSPDVELPPVAVVTPSPKPTSTPTPTPTVKPTATATPKPAATATPKPIQSVVYVSKTGTKYHYYADCSGMKNPIMISLDEAINSKKYTLCKVCEARRG